jgi:hypothetical protein
MLSGLALFCICYDFVNLRNCGAVQKLRSSAELAGFLLCVQLPPFVLTA